MDGDGSAPDPSPGSGSSGEEESSRGRAAASRAPASDDEVEDGPLGGLLSKIFGMWPKSEEAESPAAPAPTEAANPPRTRGDMIERVIAFGEKRVADVMAPRADIVAVDVETPLAKLVEAFAEAGHSRMPIYRGDLDDPIGMVHIKDVVGLIAHPDRAKPANGPVLKTIRRDVLYVPPSMRITDLLLKMQASRIHMALVIDEYGGTDGLLTIEDLVEQIVGEINDEHDGDEAPTITPRAGGGWDADARVELAEFETATGIRIEAEDEEVDTLGGIAFSLAGRVPQRGEVLSHPGGLDFEVMEADARKVRKLRIRVRPEAGEAAI